MIAFDPAQPLHKSQEPVPFRLTPNMQHFITPTGVEGLLTSAVMAIARSLTLPEFDLESCLSLFLRDEVCSYWFYFSVTQFIMLIPVPYLQVLVWFHMYNKPAADAPTHIMNNVDAWIRRTNELAYVGDGNDKVSGKGSLPCLGT